MASGFWSRQLEAFLTSRHAWPQAEKAAVCIVWSEVCLQGSPAPERAPSRSFIFVKHGPLLTPLLSRQGE